MQKVYCQVEAKQKQPANIQYPKQAANHHTTMLKLYYALVLLSFQCQALNIILPGGTGTVGKTLASLLTGDDVVILTRNSFLAGTPNRVTEQFGWVGSRFLNQNPHVSLRDWDGGDLTDIVGQDWLGWQDDALAQADVVVHLVGGFTEQRVMACERLVREAHRINSDVLHITVNPLEEEIGALSPSATSSKSSRILKCEEMVKENCSNSSCLRLECYRLEKGCRKIKQVIDDFAGR